MLRIVRTYLASALSNTPKQKLRNIFFFLLLCASIALLSAINSHQRLSSSPCTNLQLRNEFVFSEQILTRIDEKIEHIHMKEYLETISPHLSNKSTCSDKWIVVLHGSNDLIKTAAQLRSWCFIILAEGQSDAGSQTNIFYLTAKIEKELSQRSSFFRLINHMSKNQVNVRKNFGYLWAIFHKAKVIWDFDSDNELIANPATLLFSFGHQIDALTIPNYRRTFFNPYPFFLQNSQELYPRGYPRQSDHESSQNNSDLQTLSGYWPTKNIGIIHSLTQGYPDIDVIKQSTAGDTSIELKKLSENHAKDLKLIVPRRTFSPYNAQSTVHFQSSLWALLLPLSIDDQFSDIYRSYIMQRLMWDVGLQITFAGPYVRKKKFKTYDQMKLTKDSSIQISKFVQFLKDWSTDEKEFVKHAERLYLDLYKKGFIQIVDVYLMQLWLEQLRLSAYIFPKVAHKFTLAVRTFSGHLNRMNERYIPTVKMFVDRNAFDILVVLDDESDKDHLVGECLEKHQFSVLYEPNPAVTKNIHLPGYDRQQWSTFYMDQFANSDYIGVIDADGMIFSFMHPFYSIFASKQDQRIMLKPMAGDHYKEDKIALQFDLDLDFMWPNRMPMWYRWETYVNLRNYISLAWNGSTFDDAFVKFSKSQRYSQFTILSSYASRFEPNFYRIIMNNDTRGAISVGSNRGRDQDIRAGCCRSFHIGCDHPSKPLANHDHLLRYDGSDFVAVNTTEKNNIYYHHVHDYLKEMSADLLLNMKLACQTFLDNKHKPMCA